VAGECGALLAHVSTDYVFDGRKGSPYVEKDPVGPLSAYGRSKLAGEQAINDSGLERHLIVRTSWLHGPDGKNFVATILRLAAEREELRVVADQVGSPTFTGDLAAAIFHLMAAALNSQPPAPIPSKGQSPCVDSPWPPAPGLYGIYHFANAGQCSWHEFASAIVEEAKALGVHLAVRRIVSIGTEEYPLPAPRPAWSVLSTQRYQTVTGCGVPGWRDGLRRHLLEIYRGSREC
jgi:dTDP-4-dehydrorhamnose reductase